MKLGPILTAAAVMIASTPVDAQQRASAKEMRAYQVWAKAVREEFLFYRDREDDLLKVEKLDPLSVQGDLKYNLHQDLEPGDALGRIAQRDPMAWKIEGCRVTIRSFRWITTTAQQVTTVNDKRYVTDAKQYLKNAANCEKSLGLTSPRNRFREVVGILE